jgi:NhaA family Na+:H+ antiporter
MADRVFSTLERFLHIEALSGIVLLIAAAAALAWANSSAADSYEQLWHAPLMFGIGSFTVSQSLHFWINDALMTVFFLVVGMEIRREMHEGALSSLQLASLPLAAALGGVAVPAVTYLMLAQEPGLSRGWAVPTATDIAFAVGVLALLGRSIPGSVRIFLLALAIIDDIAAVLIIALFYSGGLDFTGLWIAAGGIFLVLALQRLGIASAYAYVLPGAILWAGILKMGAHPTLAGVVLGLMTPVVPRSAAENPLEAAGRALGDFRERSAERHAQPQALVQPFKRLRSAEMELLAPVVRVQAALHPWVAFGVMPLFALANAGVRLEGMEYPAVAQQVLLGVAVALIAGKPLGIFLGSWLAVRLGLARLPDGVSWQSVLLIGCLGGIGFTMSIFIATLAFGDVRLLAAAKTGVLLGSLVSGVLGLALGFWLAQRGRA